MKKQTWISVGVLALLFVISIPSAITVIDQSLQEELKNNKEKLFSLQQEYNSLQQNYTDLQQNYTDQQHQFMEIFAPSLETKLGAKVMYDNKTDRNYLWMTGEVYNRGYGMAFNTVLQVKLFIVNSTSPDLALYSLGDIDSHNFKSIAHPFYSYGEIQRWEINVNCSISK